MPPALNRDRLNLIRDVTAGLVEERRLPSGGTEAIVRARETSALTKSNWRWKRCGPRIRELIAAGWVAELDIRPDDPGPWTYQLTDAGRAVHDEHSATSGNAA